MDFGELGDEFSSRTLNYDSKHSFKDRIMQYYSEGFPF